ncbi:acetyl-CoA C-acetyltransferase [Bacillus safensis]|uniref:acetyl-CoA C-acetyltransferase n=1 Tax=Bacillus TaxID=1386 RepID=UPI00119E1729|nr:MULTISPECIES: acetyl-CoA C-acetyltransferase [Bacillus]MCK1971664.1 acetyl-CoA C-acetyltransferase [Bacillus safensis]UXC32182.1 acetyl-CoA C-acetyltransferase [Bacillus safensis]
MSTTVIVSGARTPFGKLGGALSGLSAAELGGIAIKAALERVSGSHEIDEVIMGSVLQGGQGQIPSRQAARYADLPWSVPTQTINKVCASGMRSVTTADQIMRAGDAEVIAAGGMESMSHAPYLLKKARWGYKMGDGAVQDAMILDGLTCSFTGVHMGEYGGMAAKELSITREEQDLWALRSHERAIEAQKSGFFQHEITPVTVKTKTGERLITEDESPRRDTSYERLSKLMPVFDQKGTITAGNAPGVNDGASALLLMKDTYAARHGVKPMAVILGHTQVAVEAKDFPKTPAFAIEKLLKKTGKRLEDIDLFEINEAFSAVALACEKMTGIDRRKMNINGGAVALGHPIGASGTRIILTLIHALRQRGGGIGIAAICSGGGQGDAIMIKVDEKGGVF